MACLQGFQQQDSHELLRVLLDGLQTEEAKAIAAKLKHNSAQQVLPSIALFNWLSICVLSFCAVLSTSISQFATADAGWSDYGFVLAGISFSGAELWYHAMCNECAIMLLVQQLLPQAQVQWHAGCCTSSAI